MWTWIQHHRDGSATGGARGLAAAQPQRGRGLRSAPWLAIGSALAAYAFLVGRFDFLCDDSYISFRYARHVAQGLGFTYNPGIDPPVEGFSNFLWVLVLAGVRWLGGDLGTWARVLSFACGCLLIVRVGRLLDGPSGGALGLRRSATWVGLFALAMFPPMVVWSTGGLATVPFLLLVFLAYERLLVRPGGPDWLGGGLAGLGAALMRADGIGWTATILAVCLVLALRSGDRLRVGRILAASSVVAIGFSIFEIWRITTFGDFLPNTFHAKVGFGGAQTERGVYYIARFFAVVPGALLVIGAAPFWSRWRSSEALVGALALTLATLTHVVLVGGDFMGMFRFLVPLGPFLALLLAATFDRLAAEPRTAPAGRALAVVVPASFALALFSIEPGRTFVRYVAASGPRKHYAQADQMRVARDGCQRSAALGRSLALHTEPDASIVLRAIGAAGYTSGRTILDQWGLVDPELGSNGSKRARSVAFHMGGHDLFGSLDYLEPRKPDYGWAGIVQRSDVERPNELLPYRIFERFADDRAYRSVYRPLLIPVPEVGPDRFLLLAERDPDPDGTGNGWDGPLLVQSNLGAFRRDAAAPQGIAGPTGPETPDLHARAGTTAVRTPPPWQAQRVFAAFLRRSASRL